MTATTEHKKKVRYHSQEVNKIAWTYPENLPEYALEQPGVKKQLAGLKGIQPFEVASDPQPLQAPIPAPAPYAPEPEPEPKINDYSAEIEQWLSELRTAVEDIRVSRDSQQRFNARNRAEQYKMAVDIYRAAEYIPAVATQFGSYRADFHFRVPPKLEEYDDISPLRRGTAHRYITADPVEIAYLRTIDDYEEVPVGYVYSRGEGKRDGLWVDLEFYERQKAAGQAV